jgi:hypothetical protein
VTSVGVPAVADIDRYSQGGREAERPLVSWGLYFFLLSWVTFGIYSLFMYHRRLARAEAFRVRKMNYYRSVTLFLRQQSDLAGQYQAAVGAIDDLDRFAADRFIRVHKQIRPGLALFLTFVTLGIYGAISIARLMRFWWEIQVTEQQFDQKLSPVLMNLRLCRYPVAFQPVEKVRRGFWVHILLSFVTLGIYGMVWDYQLHTDPDKVFPEFHAVEGTVLNIVRGGYA